MHNNNYQLQRKPNPDPPTGDHVSPSHRIRKRENPNKIKLKKETLTEFTDARVLGIGDGVAKRSQIDIGLIAYLPVLVREAILPWKFLCLL